MNAKRKDQDTATIYLRVSQDKTGEMLAVERQETECRALAERNGWTVREVFTDNDISATSGKQRPGFEALLLSQPERIVVWHIDRLVRLTSELERVLSIKANVHAVTAGHIDLSNPAGKAVAITVTAWSQYEGEQKALRQRAKGRQMATEGKSWWGKFTPFGFNPDGTHSEIEAAALRKVYADLLAGRPLIRLVDDLNGAGFQTSHKNTWGHVPLRTLLLNARNAGIRTYLGDEVGPALWAGIVNEATYRAAVRLLTNPERHVSGDGKRVGLLSGFATCGKVGPNGAACGGRMTRAWRGGAKSNPKAYPVYECVHRCATAQGEFADGVVLRKVIERLSSVEAGRWFGSADEELTESGADLQQQADALRLRLTELAGAFAQSPPLITIGQMTSATATLLAELGVVEERMGRAVRTNVMAGVDVEYIYQEWDGLDLARQSQIVRSVISSVVILPQGRGARWPRAENIVVT